MNGRLRLVLCGACVAIGAFHAPRSTHVLAEDLAGARLSCARAAPLPIVRPHEWIVAATDGEDSRAAHRDDARTGAAPQRR